MRNIKGPNVLIVGNDPPLAKQLANFLETRGFSTLVVAPSGELASRIEELRPDMIVLDQFFGEDGLPRLLPELRNVFTGGIMVLTAGEGQIDHIIALEEGADDFVCRSVGLREILARVRAVHRRLRLHDADDQPRPGESYGRWHVDTRWLKLRAPDGTVLDLTRTEFHAMSELLGKAGELVSRDYISRVVLGRPFSPFDRSVDNMISRIRRKMQSHLSGQPAISSVRGKGYIFDAFTPADIDLVDDAGVLSADWKRPVRLLFEPGGSAGHVDTLVHDGHPLS